MFEPENFRKKTYGIEESACDIVGTFLRPLQPFRVPFTDAAPRGDLAPGELWPLCPLFKSLDTALYMTTAVLWRHNCLFYKVSFHLTPWSLLDCCCLKEVVSAALLYTAHAHGKGATVEIWKVMVWASLQNTSCSTSNKADALTTRLRWFNRWKVSKTTVFGFRNDFNHCNFR